MLSSRTIRLRSRLAARQCRRPVPRPCFSSTDTRTTSSSSAIGASAASFAAGLAVGWALYRSSASDKPEIKDEKGSGLVGGRVSQAVAQIPHVTRTGITITTTPDLNELGTSDEVAYTKPPTLGDITRLLNENAFTVRAAPGGVDRYDGAQLASNSPCEDAFIHGSFSNPFDTGNSNASKWMAWAVFDGHCGWQLSNLLKTQLMPFVRRSLAEAKSADGSEVSEEAVQQALTKSFTTLDDVLVKSATAIIESDLPFAEKARHLEPAYAGACALLTLFDPQSRKLHVASTGDCRAVLGQKTADGKWEATALSVDCTGATPSEMERIKAQFPDEPDVVQGGRVWGLQPSRTFGDGMWKWTAELKKNLRYHFNGLSLPSQTRYKNYKDGPYVTAEPLVTTTQIPDPKEGRPSFLILATDGLWDTMSSEQAVDLVGKWYDRQQKGASVVEPEKKTEDFGPVVLGWKQQCKYEERKATFRDDNAAVHLMRNGLGGADEEMVRGALAFRYPNSRDIRDDITVQVVFFGPGQ
ncbi:phosphatase 2C-like domain-containing protein [Xylaria curta]|nr:phosphatase 2C-like domain-containing protein [Xylaria curta]